MQEKQITNIADIRVSRQVLQFMERYPVTGGKEEVEGGNYRAGVEFGGGHAATGRGAPAHGRSAPQPWSRCPESWPQCPNPWPLCLYPWPRCPHTWPQCPVWSHIVHGQDCILLGRIAVGFWNSWYLILHLSTLTVSVLNAQVRDVLLGSFLRRGAPILSTCISFSGFFIETVAAPQKSPISRSQLLGTCDFWRDPLSTKYCRIWKKRWKARKSPKVENLQKLILSDILYDKI